MSTFKNSGIDRIDLMQTFVRIVESGSLSAAATQLHTTQPTISRRLQALETLLGVKLLLRTTHAMKLTDDGQRCYQHAKTLMNCWNELEDDLKQASDEPVVRYLNQYPQMSVDWQLNDHSPNFIHDGIDCAIHVGEITDTSMVAVLLAEVPRFVVASPELLARYPQITAVEQLATLPWLALSSFYRTHILLKSSQLNASHQLEFQPKFSTDSLFALRNTILSGVGVGVCSAWMVQDDITQGKLVQVLPEWCAAPLPVYLMYPYASYYPARLRKFLQLIREAMPGIAGTRAPSRG
jgi:DNA-binding transcriptional LysR family regulator